MANSYLTPNMNLVIPVPSTDPGPDWASNLNASLTILDSHNHSPGSGVQVNPSGINMNADLTFNNFSAVSLKAVSFTDQITPLASSAPYISSFYNAGGEVYWNDAAGNQVQITQGGSVNAGAGSISGLPSGTASVAYSGVSGSYTFQQATSTAANLDVGSIAIRYPGSYPTPTGNYILVQAPSSLASGYSLTLPALPAQTNVMVLTSSGIISSITYDAVGQGMTATGANAIATSRTRSVSSTVGAGGVAISSSSGSFNTTSGTYVQITNMSVTITTSGRPVFVGLMNSSGADGSMVCAGSGLVNGRLQFSRGGTSLGSQLWQGTDSVGAPPASFYFIDPVGAGTYTYTAQVLTSATVFINNIVLTAYEL